MNNKKKSILYIIGVFLLGLIAGFLINSTLVEMRIDKFRRMGMPRGMTNFIERNLNLTEEQKIKVEDIFLEFEARADSTRNLFHEVMKKDMEWLKEELKPILTKEQIEKLRKRFIRPPRPNERDRGRFGKRRFEKNYEN